MKEKGIGRPSTYATIVDRLFTRRYVVEKYGRVFPTNLGKNVYSYLSAPSKKELHTVVHDIEGK